MLKIKNFYAYKYDYDYYNKTILFCFVQAKAKIIILYSYKLVNKLKFSNYHHLNFLKIITIIILVEDKIKKINCCVFFRFVEKVYFVVRSLSYDSFKSLKINKLFYKYMDRFLLNLN